MRNLFKLCAFATLFTIASHQAASAACSAPNLGHANDIVIQLNGSSPGGSFTGAVGATHAGATAEGAVYYDKTSKSLVFCDGTNWVSTVGGTTATSEQPVYSKTYPETLLSGLTGSQYVGIDIPANEIGQGVFQFEIHWYAQGEGSVCDLYQRKPDGTHQHVANAVYGNTVVGTKLKVTPDSSGGYTWSDAGGSSWEFNRINYPNVVGPWTGKFLVVAQGSSQCYFRLYSARRDPV